MSSNEQDIVLTCMDRSTGSSRLGDQELSLSLSSLVCLLALSPRVCVSLSDADADAADDGDGDDAVWGWSPLLLSSQDTSVHRHVARSTVLPQLSEINRVLSRTFPSHR